LYITGKSGNDNTTSNGAGTPTGGTPTASTPTASTPTASTPTAGAADPASASDFIAGEAKKPAPDPVTRIRHVRSLQGHLLEPRCVVFFPDGNRVATGSEDNTVRIWDITSGHCLHVLKGHTDAVEHLWVSPDGHVVYSVAGKEVRHWDASTGSEVSSFTLESQADLAFAAAAPYAVAEGGRDAYYTKVAEVWDLAKGVPVKGFKIYDNSAKTAISPDGSAIASVGDTKIQVIDVDSATIRWEQTQNAHFGAEVIHFSPDGSQLSIGTMDAFTTYNAANGEVLSKNPSPPIGMALISADGQWGITKVVNYPSELHNLRLWLRVASLPSSRKPLGISQDGRWVATDSEWYTTSFTDGRPPETSGDKNAVWIWDAQAAMGRTVFPFTGDAGDLRVIAVDPQGRIMASGGGNPEVQDGKVVPSDYRIRVWNVAAQRMEHMLEGHTAPIVSLAVSPNADIIASSSADGTIRFWNAASGVQQRSISLGESPGIVTFDHAGQHLLVGDAMGRIHVLTVSTGVVSRVLTGHKGAVTALDVSVDDRLAVSGSADKTIRCWDLQTGNALGTLEGHTGPIAAVRFSHDSTKIASAGGVWVENVRHEGGSFTRDYTPIVKNLARATGGSLEDAAAAVREGGQFDAGGGTGYVGPWVEKVEHKDESLVVWDVARHLPIHAYAGHDGMVDSVDFSRDDKSLISVSHLDGTVRRWDIASRRQTDCVEVVGARRCLFGPNGLIVFSEHLSGELADFNQDGERHGQAPGYVVDNGWK
jgi:WD40 repeat protein